MISDARTLAWLAARWLRYERRCPIVLQERSPRQYHCGRPDVLGIRRNRRTIEIEIKVSYRDFKANAWKQHHQVIARQPWMAAWKFYFLVPRLLVDLVKPELPEGTGLMTLHQCVPCVVIETEAPVNAQHRRLTIKECIHAVLLMANQSVAFAPMPEPEYQI